MHSLRPEGWGKVMFSVCPHLGGGYPYPIMLCNITQNAMGQLGGGTLPGPAGGDGGYPGGGVPCQGGTLAGPGGVPS